MGLISNLREEATYVRGMVSVLGALRATGQEDFTVADAIERWVEKTPGALAIMYEDQRMTYAALDAAANRVVRWAEASGIKKGDVVALVMENKPEYIVIWYAMAKMGARCALINNNLAGAQLAHTLNISEADNLILDAALVDNYTSAADQLDRPMKVWAQGPSTPQGMEDWDAAVSEQSPEALPTGMRDGIKNKDHFVYIYTSGTTGLPKAANISHMRFLNVGLAFGGSMQMKPSDRMYVTLPLYHATGGVGGVGAALFFGSSLVIRKKFSASQFFDDCIKYEATAFTYIGELCRYLLNAPENPNEQNHKIRICMGNGLRPDVWGPFQERYALPKIVEFYGSTEGNIALFNITGKEGSIGRIPKYLEGQLQTKIVKFDVESEEVVRGPDGFCMLADPMEAGEAIGRIDETKPGGSFEGYNNAEATAKKILTDVFEKGDKWFRSGDLLKKDERGFYYFVDRIGDTFRWKGENVATSEVAEVLSQVPGLEEANVYGVSVPGADGRAGMASVVIKGTPDFAKMEEILDRDLAPYAQPLFLRVASEMEVTGTFKHRKVELVKDGFDPDKIPDPVYFRNPETGHFEQLDAAGYQRIVNGEVRV